MVKLAADISSEYWEDPFPWLADVLLRIRRIVGEVRVTLSLT